ncbi:hypothetical protein C0991_000272 [Blastosporella zonata]|nr:hypothetical protein C0991_000272 [Blastosporella zonata]
MPTMTPTPTDIKLTTDTILEMQCTANSGNPMVTSVGKITLSWLGHILEKDDRKYLKWAHTMKLELSMVQLWEYIFDPIIPPDQTYQPQAFCMWTANN